MDSLLTRHLETDKKFLAVCPHPVRKYLSVSLVPPRICDVHMSGGIVSTTIRRGEPSGTLSGGEA